MDLKDKTTEALEKEQKALQVATWIFGCLLLTLFAVCIYGLLMKDDSDTYAALIIVPIALSASVSMNYQKIRKIKSELASGK